MIIPVSTLAQIDCGTLELSEFQIHEIIKKERENRDDLPPAYPKYDYEVKKRGCYYEYYEKEQPYNTHNHHRFTINKFGIIVRSLASHGLDLEFKCPGKIFSKSELREIIKNLREKRNDLPPPFSNYRTQLDRKGCLNYYFELELPKGSKGYMVFEIDPFGELMNTYRTEPKK